MARGNAGHTGASPSETRLVLVGEVDGEPLTFVLKQGDNTVGALSENDFVIDACGVSRRHAVISCNDGDVAVTDSASKNGTLVNGMRIHEGTLSVGDLICFGPAMLRLEVAGTGGGMPAGDGATQRQIRGQRARRKGITDTPTGDGGEVSERWFGALDRIGDLLAGDGDAGVAGALEVLVSALRAPGAGFIEWDRASDLRVVRHTAGDFRPSGEFDDLLNAAGQHQPKRGSGLVVNSRVQDGASPVALAVATDGSPKLKAVAVLGNFPLRRGSGRFLELFLKLVLRSLPDAPASGPVRLRRPVRDLVFPEGYVVGRSERLMSVYHQLRHLLNGDLPVLITGETGVGKEFIARILHASSVRSAGPFVAVNCAALPADLLEAELFGIEAGIATGVSKREGKMQLADRGVVFLDEIGDMSPALQAKLLRALQEKEVHPVGARQPVPLDVRILAATNTDLKERIGEGRFRSDLYYRIAGYTLDIPPLRERRGDIAALVEFMMQRVSIEIDKLVSGISVKALRALVDAPWPGNVRELEHEVRRLVYLCPPDQPITVAMVSPAVLAEASAVGAETHDPESDLTLSRHVDALEHRLIALALARTGGKRAPAARLLGISRYGLALKMQRLGLND